MRLDFIIYIFSRQLVAEKCKNDVNRQVIPKIIGGSTETGDFWPWLASIQG